MKSVKEAVRNMFSMTENRKGIRSECGGNCAGCMMKCPYGANLWIPAAKEARS